MKKRIGIVVPEFGAGGGVPSVALFLNEAIKRDGRWASDVISLPTSRRDPDSVRLVSPHTWLRGCRVSTHSFTGVEYRSVGCIASELEFQRYMPRPALARVLEPYALVQAVTGGPAAAFATLSRRRPTVAFVATLAGHERATRLETERGIGQVWLAGMTRATTAVERRALSRLDHVFAESAYTRDLVAPYAKPGRVSVAPPGVDTELFRPAKTYAHDGYLLSVGRFDDPRKNVRMLLRAYAALRRASANAPKLVLAGKSGPSASDRAYAHELGLDGAWEARVDLSLSALADVYRGASLFLLSSDEEGLGIVILEAMASGLPVIATRCGGPDLIVEDAVTGQLVPTGAHEEMAAEVGRLLQNRGARERMAVAARERAERLYSRAAAARTYLDIYASLLERPNA